MTAHQYVDRYKEAKANGNGSAAAKLTKEGANA
jgi:hypothetical protein